ncbi:MAG TPA: ABC transporter substrate-binding protein [Candidatus Limnocylindrales bacterium]|nr:ABC transporter substrate-binding protein [Candidatus Limnocylindrales bacterium]
MPRLLTIGASLLFVAAACGGGGASATPGGAPTNAASQPAGSQAAGAQPWVPDPTKLAAAIAEGGTDNPKGLLTTIALPPTWCNYKDLITGYTAKTGIVINGLNPDGSSQQEVDAIKANQANKGPAAPDVIDVGLSFGPDAKAQKLIAAYKVATWDSIPASAKDADGYWYGDYYGVLSFEINTDAQPKVPADWADLLKADYHGQVALSGNPVKSNQAISGVWAAAFANGGGADNVQPGLDFFKKLNDAGNFVPVIAKTPTVVSGDTPVRITWTYNALADKDAQAGKTNITVVVPKTGRFGGMYVQAISAYAPHPNAAKLWMDWLYSDEGQNLWLKGYCNPIRYDDMVSRGVVPADLAAKLPDSKGAFLPTLDQISAATKAITTGWPTTVGVVVPD